MGQSLGQRGGYVCTWSVFAAAICFWIAGHLFAAQQNTPAARKATESLVRPDIVFVQTSMFALGPLAQRFPKGSWIVRLGRNVTKGAPVHLTEEFFAAADPQVSFDGTKVLFSGQKNPGMRWQIWEMDLNGNNKRQITQCPVDCLRGAYLPADEIAFTVEESRGQERHSHLAVVKADGSQLRRITFGPADFQLETVLRDGRIIASAPWPLTSGKKNVGPRALYTLRPDGTALESFRCEHRGAMTQGDADELKDGSLVFVQEPRKEGEVGGALMHIQRGSLAAAPFGMRDAIYESPRQISTEELIVAKAAAAPVGSATKFDLYAVRTETGALGEEIFADAHLSSIQPMPVAPHDVPKHFWSMLDPESNSGYFISLNSYLSADVPGGRIATPIAKLRVLTIDATDGQERNLGEAPVESDGSFYVRVPANTPVRFVLLDAKGQTIHEEHGWVWARPGEQRGCTGCHGDKNLAPENHWPMTLKRFDTPTPLGDIDHAPATSQAN